MLVNATCGITYKAVDRLCALKVDMGRVKRNKPASGCTMARCVCYHLPLIVVEAVGLDRWRITQNCCHHQLDTELRSEGTCQAFLLHTAIIAAHFGRVDTKDARLGMDFSHSEAEKSSSLSETIETAVPRVSG